mgnify:CR=1 FL=1
MKGELPQKCEGRVVAIKDGELVDVYHDEVRAFEDVATRYGFVHLLMKGVEEFEEPVDIPAYVLGLMGARLPRGWKMPSSTCAIRPDRATSRLGSPTPRISTGP